MPPRKIKSVSEGIAPTDLAALIHYEPETGAFTWKVDLGQRARVGGVVGTLTKHGYRRVRVGGTHCFMHRIAFLLMTGEFPNLFVDHINGVRDDNRWENLRLCERAENARNAKRRADTVTGAKGVGKRSDGRYRARIRVDGVRKSLGDFKTVSDAQAAYALAARQLHGEFSRVA